MIYHYLKNVEGYEALETLHAHEAADAGVIQWHRDDYTVVAEAPYEVVGKLRQGTPRLKVGEERYRVEDLEDARKHVFEASTYDVVGESDQEHFVVWYGLGPITMLERENTFPDEATLLVESFVAVVAPLAEAAGTPELDALALAFVGRYADFLDAYKSLGRSDVARYISKIGIAQARAERDLEVILGLVKGYSET